MWLVFVQICFLVGDPVSNVVESDLHARKGRDETRLMNNY